MKAFNIKITEKLIKNIEVKADSLEDALIIIKSKYKNDEIVIDYSNFRDVTFESHDFETEYKALVDELIEYVCTSESNQTENISKKLNRLRELNTH